MDFKSAYGVTIDNAWDPDLDKKLALLPQNSIARIVIDNPNQIYIDLAKKLQGIGIEPLIQVLDSYAAEFLSEKGYIKRSEWIRKNFDFCEWFEVANEIGPANNWSPKWFTNIALHDAMINYGGKKRLATVFYYPEFDGVLANGGMLDKKNKLGDALGISYYPISMDDFMTNGAVIEKWILDGKVDCISEIGVENWPDVTPEQKKNLIDWGYRVGRPTFAWDALSEMKI